MADGGVGLQPHSILHSALEGAELSGTYPGHFSNRERPQGKMNRKPAGGQNPSEPFKEGRTLLKLSGIEPPIIGSAALAQPLYCLTYPNSISVPNFQQKIQQPSHWEDSFRDLKNVFHLTVVPSTGLQCYRCGQYTDGVGSITPCLNFTPQHLQECPQEINTSCIVSTWKYSSSVTNVNGF